MANAKHGNQHGTQPAHQSARGALRHYVCGAGGTAAAKTARG